MNAFQEQSLILALVCLAATLSFHGVVRSAPKSWLSRAITVNLAALAAIFGALTVVELNGERSEIAASLVSELPFGVVVACLCVAQAGYLPLKIGGPPLAVVAGRPRLRLLLVSAGPALPAVWLLAAVFGFLWPSPAVQALAPAPLEFVIFKGLLMAPAAFYAGLAAALFLYAAGATSLDATLRLKNAAFALAACCLAMVALESAVYAGVRAWLPDEERVSTLHTLMAVEMVLAVACVSAFILGVALRYTPAVTTHLARRVATHWLPEQDHFDAHRWRAVVGGVTRGVTRATRRINVAAGRLGLSQEDTDHAVGTVQQIAVMRSGFRDTDAATIERARALRGLQSEVMRDEGLVRRMREIAAGSAARGAGSESVAPLHAELDAALELMDPTPNGQRDADGRPVWFYLAAVAASDVDLVDASRVGALYDDATRLQRVLEAYGGLTAARDGLPSS